MVRDRPQRAGGEYDGRVLLHLLIQPETRMVIDRLAQRRAEGPSETATCLLQAGVQAELIRQRWLGGMRSLSARQREAALLLLRGMSYKQLAAKMGISYWTANDYAQHAVRAFGQAGELGFWRRYAFLLEVYRESDLVPEDEEPKE